MGSWIVDEHVSYGAILDEAERRANEEYEAWCRECDAGEGDEDGEDAA